MSCQRRSVFWGLLSLGCAALVVYLAWTPYRPATLYRAIPAHASLLSSHQNLGGRWHNLATNPILRAFLHWPTNGPAASCLRLANKETLIAYVPAGGITQEPTWICASWIGSYSQFLRWWLSVKRVPGLTRAAQDCHGRPIWISQPQTDSATAHWSLAFGEGVALICFSSDTNAMRQVIMAYDGRAPSMASAGHPELDQDAAIQDKGWWRWPAFGRAPKATTTLTYAIDHLDAEGLAATLRLEPAPHPQAPLALDLARGLDDRPILIALLPLDTILNLPGLARATPAWWQIVRQTLAAGALLDESQPLTFTLLSGPDGGGFGKEPWRMQVPALTIYMKVKRTDTIKPFINNLLDQLNARYRCGLIIDPSALRVGTTAIYTLEATAANWLATIEDRPAFAVDGQWLILSSNARSLLKLLKDPSTTASAGPQPRWQKNLSAHNPSMLIWADLDICGRALQLPLTGLRALRSTPAAPPAASGAMIPTIKTWLEDVRPLKTGRLWMETEGAAPRLHLEIGSQPERGVSFP